MWVESPGLKVPQGRGRGSARRQFSSRRVHSAHQRRGLRGGLPGGGPLRDPPLNSPGPLRLGPKPRGLLFLRGSKFSERSPRPPDRSLLLSRRPSRPGRGRGLSAASRSPLGSLRESNLARPSARPSQARPPSLEGLCSLLSRYRPGALPLGFGLRSVRPSLPRWLPERCSRGSGSACSRRDLRRRTSRPRGSDLRGSNVGPPNLGDAGFCEPAPPAWRLVVPGLARPRAMSLLGDAALSFAIRSTRMLRPLRSAMRPPRRC